MNNQAINRVFGDLKETFGITAVWHEQPIRGNRLGGIEATAQTHSIVEVTAGGGVLARLDVIRKVEFRNPQITHLIAASRPGKNVLLVADSISSNSRKNLRENGINYVDAAGNIFIKTPKIFIGVEARRDLLRDKRVAARERKGWPDRAFTKSGLRVVYHLLADGTMLNRSYRDIAEATHVALDTISKTLNALKEKGFILSINNKLYKLHRKKELLEKWVDLYNDRLKPSLFTGTYRFKDANTAQRWKEIRFNIETLGMTCWGGEPAGGLLTGHLHPEIFTMYTTETQADLIKSYKLIPDPLGNVQVYRPFWDLAPGDTTAPPLVVYAELISSGDGRNIETAQLLWKSPVEHLI